MFSSFSDRLALNSSNAAGGLHGTEYWLTTKSSECSLKFMLLLYLGQKTVQRYRLKIKNENVTEVGDECGKDTLEIYTDRLLCRCFIS